VPKTTKRATQSQKKPLYRQKPAPSSQLSTPDSQLSADLPHAHPIVAAHFQLREDGSIETVGQASSLSPSSTPQLTTPQLIYSSDSPFVRLYHGNCFELLDAIHARYGDAGRFDCIFADPPYFLSNGGITCHAGKMVKVDKGDWDKSRGPELNHEFNKEWLMRCQRVLKPNGTIWVSGTHHVIFSIGYAMQQLGFKILNDIAWEKPNPPPNLSCRYFTHSTETILWAAKSEKSKHVFNYQEMRKVTGKQMKTVWTMSAPGGDEKTFGKHPTQKPVALIERCLLASTDKGDLVLDPFLGGGTTAVAAMKLKRGCVGVELDESHAKLAKKRIENQVETGTDLFSLQVSGGGHVRKQKISNPRRIRHCVYGDAHARHYSSSQLHALGCHCGQSRTFATAVGIFHGAFQPFGQRLRFCSGTNRLATRGGRPLADNSLCVRVVGPHEFRICN